MLDWIINVNTALNNFIWGLPAMICIIGAGLWLTIRTRAIQVRKFGTAMNSTLGRVFEKKTAKDGSISPFQAVCTALAGTVGTGNIAGVAGAVAIGGPGAVFWMWCSAFLGMCTKFSEVVLAIHFREKNAQGEYIGGPMYYIKNGLGSRWGWLASLYAIFGVMTVFGTGNATQVNTIVSSIDTALTSFNLINADQAAVMRVMIGIIIALVVSVVLLGGINRIGQVTEKLVPFMALLYIVLSIGVIVLNVKAVPRVFRMIFEGAFNPSAFTGGLVGSLFISLKKGVSRGIFSNEAGLGTGSIAHAASDVDDPIRQGYFGIFEVFADTIVICSMTAFVILISGESIHYGAAAGAELTISGFTAVYGNIASLLAALAMCCFAFSTIIGWGLYGTRCMEFLVGSKANRGFMIVYSFVAILGATIDLGLLWDLAETFNGMMVIPNLIGLFLLSGTVVKMVRERVDGK